MRTKAFLNECIRLLFMLLATFFVQSNNKGVGFLEGSGENPDVYVAEESKTECRNIKRGLLLGDLQGLAS